MSAPTRPPDNPPEPEPAPSPRSSLMQPGGWRLQKRLYTSPLRELAAVIVGVIASLAITAVLVTVSGAGVGESFRALYDGAFGNRDSALETLVSATPLILTGLAAAFAFKAGIWNIGGEGQFFAGAMGAWWFADTFGGIRPVPLLFVGIFLTAALAGAAWATIASVLKARYGTNEILTTVMLNFVILFILSYLLSGPWRSPDTFYFQTERMADNTSLPRVFSDSRLHWGFLIAVLIAVVVYFVLSKTSLGFDIRGLGVNLTAAKYKGTNVGRLIVIVMALSGAIAGIAGAGELTGIHHQLQLDIAVDLGFIGIIIALVARLNPLAVIVTAIAFGGPINGATNVQVVTGIPAALVRVIQGVTLIMVLVAAVAVRYRVVTGNRDE